MLVSLGVVERVLMAVVVVLGEVVLVRLVDWRVRRRVCRGVLISRVSSDSDSDSDSGSFIEWVSIGVVGRGGRWSVGVGEVVAESGSFAWLGSLLVAVVVLVFGKWYTFVSGEGVVW